MTSSATRHSKHWKILKDGWKGYSIPKVVAAPSPAFHLGQAMAVAAARGISQALTLSIHVSATFPGISGGSVQDSIVQTATPKKPTMPWTMPQHGGHGNYGFRTQKSSTGTPLPQELPFHRNSSGVNRRHSDRARATQVLENNNKIIISTRTYFFSFAPTP